jgi:Family of unknown function (DUF6510)
MQMEEMRLDGNAAAGILREVFVHDMTAAVATCRGCGATGMVGGLLEYGQEMGAILRCPKCEAVLLRVVHAPDGMRLDPSGLALLMIAANALRYVGPGPTTGSVSTDWSGRAG